VEKQVTQIYCVITLQCSNEKDPKCSVHQTTIQGLQYKDQSRAVLVFEETELTKCQTIDINP